MRGWMQVLLFAAAFVLFLFFGLGCATKAPDVPICMELSISEARCKWTVSPRVEIVNDKNKLDGKTWWDMRPTNLSVPSSSWAEIKKFILEACTRMKSCSNLTDWEKSVNTIDQSIKAKGAAR